MNEKDDDKQHELHSIYILDKIAGSDASNPSTISTLDPDSTCSMKEFKSISKNLCKDCFHCTTVNDVAGIMERGWNQYRLIANGKESGSPLLVFYAIYQEILATILGREIEAVGLSPTDAEVQTAVNFVSNYFQSKDEEVQ